MRKANYIYRKMLANLVRQGYRTLRVYGSKATRYFLLDQGSQIIIGPLAGFPTLAAANVYGEQKLKTKPKKLLKLAA